MPRALVASILWSALVIWAGAILWLSSLSPSELPPAAFLAWDKLNHFAAFTVGGWLTASTLRISRPRMGPTAAIFLAVALLAGFGAMDEAAQLLTPGRTGGDVYDWIADLLGALAGALSARFTHGTIDRIIPRP